MEDTLGVPTICVGITTIISLNPCSNGRYSRSNIKLHFMKYVIVLILVLMEDTLGV